jgi:hypothetical protein
MKQEASIPFFTYSPNAAEDLNSGTAWSEQDDADLIWMIKHHRGVSAMALFMCRTEQEVRERARELGYDLGRGTGKQRDNAAR